MKNLSSRVLLLFPSEEVLAAVSIILSMMLMLLCGNIKMKNIIRGAISRLDKKEKKKKTMRWLTIFISGYLVPFSWIFLLSLLRICVLNERSRGRIPCWCNRSNIKMHFMRWLSRDIFLFPFVIVSGSLFLSFAVCWIIPCHVYTQHPFLLLLIYHYSSLLLSFLNWMTQQNIF